MAKIFDSGSSRRFSLSNVAAIAIIIVISVIILRELESFLQPFFIAVFFYYISDPIITSLKKKKVPIFITHLVPLFLVILALFTVGWIVGAHIDDLASQFPTYKRKIQGLFQSSVVWFIENAPIAKDKIRAVLAGQTIPLAPIQKLINAILGNFFGFMTFSLLVTFFLLFLLQESASLPKRLQSAFGTVRSEQFIEVGQRINRGIIRYVYVKTVASLTVGVISTIFMLFFGLDLAIFWGTLIFFLNFVPYVGSIVAVTFPVTIAVLQFTSIAPAIALLIILMGCQILVGNFLEPKFAGQQLNLSPLVVLLSLMFWGWLWGVVGLILSIPIMVSIKIILENIPATREIAIMMSHVSPRRGATRRND